MFMLKIPAANLKPVDRYGADQVQFGGSTKSQPGDVSGGWGGVVDLLCVAQTETSLLKLKTFHLEQEKNITTSLIVTTLRI